MNCQAYSAALYVALHERGLLTTQVLKSKDSYLEALKGIHSAPMQDEHAESVERIEEPAQMMAEVPTEQIEQDVPALTSPLLRKEEQRALFEDTSRIREMIHRLHDTLIFATVDYDIWCVLMASIQDDRFKPTIELHATYFFAAIRAHHVATITGLASMYERKETTINLRNLLDAIEKFPQAPSAVRDELAKLSAAATKIARKISFIRKNVLGHNSSTLSTDITYNAGPTAKELRVIIDETREFLNYASTHIDAAGYQSTWNSAGSALRLLEALKATNLSDSEGI